MGHLGEEGCTHLPSLNTPLTEKQSSVILKRRGPGNVTLSTSSAPMASCSTSSPPYRLPRITATPPRERTNTHCLEPHHQEGAEVMLSLGQHTEGTHNVTICVLQLLDTQVCSGGGKQKSGLPRAGPYDWLLTTFPPSLPTTAHWGP